MSPTSKPHRPDPPRFPRVSGDEPPVNLLWQGADPFSPRERG